MDPTANLLEAVKLARQLTSLIDGEDYYEGLRDPAPREDDVERLGELVIALHDWLKGGGFAPFSRPERAWLARVPDGVRTAARRILDRTSPEVDSNDAVVLAGFVVELQE